MSSISWRNCAEGQLWVVAASEDSNMPLTTAVLNGLFAAVRNQYVREIKCNAAGDPYCEREII